MPKREQLPEDYHMTVIALEGRYYPVRTEREKETGLLRLGSSPHLHWETEYAYGIPYALGPQPTRGIISFPTYWRTIDFCHRTQEEFRQWLWWQELAAQTEVYPERIIWYREQIAQRCRQEPHWSVSGRQAHTWVILPDGSYCGTWAETVDEAWEKLSRLVECALQERQTTLSA